MEDPTIHLRPGERMIYRVERSRKWQDLVLTVLVDLAAIAAVFFLFRYLERTIVDRYIRVPTLLGQSDFMVINLFLGTVPLLIALAMVQDFIYIFFVNLVLTDERIVGRVGGPLWVNDLDISLADIRSISIQPIYLVVTCMSGRRVRVSGFHDLKNFLAAYQHQKLKIDGIDEDLFEPLPDAFTFQNVH